MKLSRIIKTSRTTVLIALASSMALAVANANSVYLKQNQYSYDVGGEFSAYTTPQNYLNNYVSSTIVNGGFETFCVESKVDFYPGKTYSFTLSDTDSQGRSLSLGTAFLYYEFAKGTLAGYDYNNASGERKADGGLLQAAIWWLQGGQTYSDGNYLTPSGDPSSSNYNPYYALALSTLAKENEDATAPSNGAYGVDILQLWDGTAPAQNQLVLVPDDGTTASLLGMSLIGMLLIQYRCRKLQFCPAKSA